MVAIAWWAILALGAATAIFVAGELIPGARPSPDVYLSNLPVALLDARLSASEAAAMREAMEKAATEARATAP